jgi:hypothetical protein
MIALDEDGLFVPFEQRQKVEHLTRGRSPIYIVPEEDRDRSRGGMKLAMHVDFGKQNFQKIDPSMNVSGGIDPDASRQPR